MSIAKPQQPNGRRSIRILIVDILPPRTWFDRSSKSTAAGIKRVRHARRVQDVIRPLFPGYVFAQSCVRAGNVAPDSVDLWARALVRIGDRPAFVDCSFVDRLRARDIDAVIAEPAAPYKLGQKVRLSGGPLDGLIGRTIEMSDKDRLILLTSMLHQAIRPRVTITSVRSL